MDALPQGALVGASAVTIGDKAVVMGGRGKANTSLETWSFDPAGPAGSQWTRLADMPEERSGASAVYYDDSALGVFSHYGPDLVFVIGGQDSYDLSRDTILMYDANSNSWHYAPFMPLPRGKAWAAAAISDNKVYSMGGITDDVRVLNECLVLDLENPAFDWQSAGQMPTARYGHGCTVIGTSVYSIGGFYVDALGRTASLDVVEVLDGTAGYWTEIAALPESRGYSFVVQSPVKGPEGVLYVIGGYSMTPEKSPYSYFVDKVLEYEP
jgi:N-acetylneuraminic acid mutarotase